MSGAQNQSTTGPEGKASRPYRTRILAGILAAGLVVAGTLATVSPAEAASTPSCSQVAAVVTCTVTFSYTGSEQQFTVPAGISAVTALAIGGHGGAHSNAGGEGASTSGSFAVSAGQTLYVEVAGAGSNWVPGGGAAGGFNGGGYATAMIGPGFDLGGGGGGGASDVRTLTSTDAATLASRLVVAAGGGGGGFEGNGGNAGNAGGPSSYNSAGGAGTAIAGGAGGAGAAGYGPTAFGIAGTLGAGGASAPSTSSGGGGGGGGGLYGGGGAGTYGGGGGGSSLGTAGGVSSAAASVTLSYSPSVSSIEIGSSSGSVTAGGTAMLSATGSDGLGDTWDATSSTTFVSSDASDNVTGSSIRFGTAGPRTITGVDNTRSATTAVAVTIGPASGITIARSASSVVAGGTATFTASAQDAGGDQLGDVTGSTTFTSSDVSDQATGSSIRFGTAGARTITAHEATFTDETTIGVTVGPQTRLTVTPSTATAVAGDTVTLTATAQDAGGDQLGDITSTTTFTSSNGSDSVVGDHITVGTAGPRTITAVRGAFSDTTTIGVSVGPVATLVISPSQSLAVAGETRTFSAEGFDISGDDLGDVTSATTFTSTDISDVIDGAQVVFGVAGPRTIAATDGAASANTNISVTVGPVASLTITASRTNLAAGESATLAAEGFDVSGDDIGDVTQDTNFTSDDGTDVVTGSSILFTTPGVRTITGADGAATDTVNVTVTVGVIATVVIDPATAGVVAGGSQAFTAVGYDAEHNPLGDVTAITTFTSSAAADAITQNSIRFTTAGSDTVTATVGAVSTTATVDVSPDAAHPASISLRVSDAHVLRGGSITLHVTGVDAYGNSIPGLTGRATFTSDWAVDVVHGSTITFPHASIHHITATLGALDSTVTVTVTAPTSAVVAYTGFDPTLPFTGALAALLLGLLAFYASARSRGARSFSKSSRNLR